MILEEVLAGVALRAALAADSARSNVAGLAYDSRKVGKGFPCFSHFAKARDWTGRDSRGTRWLAVRTRW